jgi:hypothetical protein
MKNLYDQYIDKKQRVRQLNAELSDIENQVISHLAARRSPYQGVGGTISIAIRHSFYYSDSFYELAEKLKNLQKMERDSGIANKDEIPYIKYTPNNNL